MMPGNVSNLESKFVLALLNKLFGWTGLAIQNGLLRKCGHFIEYMIFGIFLMKTAGFYGADGKRRQVILVALVVILASIDERIQYFVPGRASCVTDVLIDAFGAALGMGIFYFFSRCIHKRKKRKDTLK